MTEKSLAATRATIAGITSTTSKVSYGSAGVTMFAGLNIEAWGVIAGIVVAVLTLCVNVYYQRKKHKLDVLLAQSQLEKTAISAVDKAQQDILQKMMNDFKVQFGDLNKRKSGDRRVFDDPNYKGPERRVGSRRGSINGDGEDAKTLRELVQTSKEMMEKLAEIERHYKERYGND